MFLSNLEPVEPHQCAKPIMESCLAIPPGAVQGMKGSGCFHRSNSASVSRSNSFHPYCQHAACFFIGEVQLPAYHLLPRLVDSTIGFED